MSAPSPTWQPSGQDFRAARERIKAYVNITPLLRAEPLDRAGKHVFVKTENLQRSGSFKVRGAFNALAQLLPDDRARGVITHSSGNHAQAVALAARDLGLADRGQAYPCTVVMPENAPACKVERVQRLGAQIEFVGQSSQEREEKARELAAATGRQLIPSYDDPRVIVGQGTLGYEIMDQWMGMPLRTRLISLVAGPVSGGGLMGGVASALRARGFSGRIAGVEPAEADDTRRSLEAGARIRIEPPQTICDALRVQEPGAITFPLLQKCGLQMATATDDQVRAAVLYLLRELKLLVEPSGAVAVAAWLNRALDDDNTDPEGGGDAILILSGGNVDPSLVAEWSK